MNATTHRRQCSTINITAKLADPESGTVTAVITTGAPDRDGEVVVPRGIRLTAFKKNPVVLFGHDYSALPVGKAEMIRYDGNRDALVARVRFHMLDEQSRNCYELFKGGFLRAFSVGFIPLRRDGASGPPTDQELKDNPSWKDRVRYVYRATELVEFSVVPVPANADALAMSLKAGRLSLCKSVSDAIEWPRPVVATLITDPPIRVKLLGRSTQDEIKKLAWQQAAMERGRIVYEPI